MSGAPSPHCMGDGACPERQNSLSRRSERPVSRQDECKAVKYTFTNPTIELKGMLGR